MIIVPAKPGESCPCCGQPIKTRDPDLLYLIGWIRQTGYKPIELEDIRKAQEEAGDE